MGQQKVKSARRVRGASSAPSKGRPKKQEVEHPLAAPAGVFKEDPLWDEFVEALQLARAKEDAQGDVSG